MASLDIKHLQKECHELKNKLANQSILETELEAIKGELEKVLETHKTLQEVALALEEKNRNLQQQYKGEVKERMKLDELRLDLENEIEAKAMSFENLERRMLKMKDKMKESEDTEELLYALEKDKKKANEKIKTLEEELQGSYYQTTHAKRQRFLYTRYCRSDAKGSAMQGNSLSQESSVGSKKENRISLTFNILMFV